MSLVSNTLLSFSLSADAFAAAICKGASLKKPGLLKAMRIGLLFGVVEAVTPIIGWIIGLAASKAIEAVDHWVAFAILAFIGGKMVLEGFTNHCEVKKESHTFSRLLLTAIGTSIDSMAVGVTLALTGMNIWIAAAMIGTATFIMATIGVMGGHYIGEKAGKTAEVLGGLCLIAIGVKILFEHGVF